MDTKIVESIRTLKELDIKSFENSKHTPEQKNKLEQRIKQLHQVLDSLLQALEEIGKNI